MNAIEKHLHEHFASLQGTDDVASNATPMNRATMMGDTLPETLEVPFAKVNSVVADSPADAAGLKAGDEIRNLGYVNRANHDGLKKVAECVQGNEGVSLVSISFERILLSIYPSAWVGDEPALTRFSNGF